MSDEQTIFERIANHETNSHIIYEDDTFMAIVREKGACLGHTTLFTKKKFLIFEQLPVEIASDVLLLANKISVALFETLGAHGTNIIINNGTDAGQEINHFSVDIIPRQENDGITVDWKPKEIPQDQLKGYAKSINDALVRIEYEQNRTPEQPSAEEQPVIDADNQEEDKPNYLLKQLDRLP